VSGGAGIGLERLSLNQATVKHLTLEEAVALCVRHEIPAIGLWRDRVAEIGVARAAAAVRSAGLHVSSLCRGGFFTRASPGERRAALADNRAAIAEAAELGADALVLVSGGLVPGSRDLGLARRIIADSIGELVPVAQRLGVRLGLEPLHPVFCADRCVISSLGEAVDLAALFPASTVGVVVDTYHVWWDARLAEEIARAGSLGQRIASYQVCDWVLPLPADTLLGRGHLGDGVIDFGPVSTAVAAAGYRGYVEVEIFNAAVWAAPPDQTAATVRERFATALGPRPPGAPGSLSGSVWWNLESLRRAGGHGPVSVRSRPGPGPVPARSWPVGRRHWKLTARVASHNPQQYQPDDRLIRCGCRRHVVRCAWLGHPRLMAGGTGGLDTRRGMVDLHGMIRFVRATAGAGPVPAGAARREGRAARLRNFQPSLSECGWLCRRRTAVKHESFTVGS
jgi:sugar phosphate isomerase/epimerase